jgi:hypothetical protein
MRVGDGKEAARAVLIIDNDVLGADVPVPITDNDNSNLIHRGMRKGVATPVTALIKVKRDLELLVRRHIDGHGKSLLIKVNSRVRLVKDSLK